MSEAEVKFNLKAVINKHKTKVLFAEVGNDFVDLIFSFLILPLGNVLQVLQRHYGDKAPLVIGRLNTLYNGLSNLCCHPLFPLEGCKPMVLNTEESAYAFPHLAMKFKLSTYFSLGEAYFVVYKLFTEDKASFILCDNLFLVPNVEGSIVQTLKSVGVNMVDMDGSATRDVNFGLNEVMDFLMALLFSSQPLTSIILDTSVKSELQSCGISLHPIQVDAVFKAWFHKSTKKVLLVQAEKDFVSFIFGVLKATTIPEKMILKAMIQKSTKKFLLVQAEKDFVSILFGVLKVPLGLVDLHLGGESFFGSLYNLYTSIIEQLDPEILRRGCIRHRLMEPQTFSSNDLCSAVDGIFNAYRSRMYMVTDDLTVTLLNVTSALSFLDQMKISSSDVQEVEIHIWLEEARNILKASLTSNCALSNGLVGPLLKKQVKPKE